MWSASGDPVGYGVDAPSVAASVADEYYDYCTAAVFTDGVGGPG